MSVKDNVRPGFHSVYNYISQRKAVNPHFWEAGFFKLILLKDYDLLKLLPTTIDPKFWPDYGPGWNVRGSPNIMTVNPEGGHECVYHTNLCNSCQDILL